MAFSEIPGLSYSRLPVSRWPDYRLLRLDALRSDPSAFGSEYEEEAEYGEEIWKNRISDVIFAIIGGELVGMAGHIFLQRRKMNHVAHIVGFYVKSEFRGRGIGLGLMEETIQAIKENRNIRKFGISVNSPQIAAQSLYGKLGFEVVGTLKGEVQVDGQFFDQIIMEKYL